MSPSGCSVTYSTTVSPAAAFMTPLDSGRGMKWQTDSEADAGTYTVTVTATGENVSESTVYIVTVTYHEETKHYANVCKNAVFSASAGSTNVANLVNGRFEKQDCDSCAHIEVESGTAWFMLDLGSEMDISTIVFHGDWADTTDYGSTMVRKYGLSDDIDDLSNK